MAAVLTYEGMLGALTDGNPLNPPLSGYAFYPAAAFAYPQGTFSATVSRSVETIFDDGDDRTEYLLNQSFTASGTADLYPANFLTYGLTQNGANMLWLPGGEISFTTDSQSGSYTLDDDGDMSSGSVSGFDIYLYNAVVYNVGDSLPSGAPEITGPSIWWSGGFQLGSVVFEAQEMTGFIAGLQSPPTLTYSNTDVNTDLADTTTTTTENLSIAISIPGWTWWLTPG